MKELLPTQEFLMHLVGGQRLAPALPEVSLHALQVIRQLVQLVQYDSSGWLALRVARSRREFTTCRGTPRKEKEPDVTDAGAIRSGLTGTAELVVEAAHTAPRIGSGEIHVLGTPVMINLMEAAALAAMEHLLPEGLQSLGTRLEVSHIAATPVGMKVQATAEVTAVDGNKIEFKVEAHDEHDLIGKGTHKRLVVNVERFDRRVQRKLTARGDE